MTRWWPWRPSASPSRSGRALGPGQPGRPGRTGDAGPGPGPDPWRRGRLAAAVAPRPPSRPGPVRPGEGGPSGGAGGARPVGGAQSGDRADPATDAPSAQVGAAPPLGGDGAVVPAQGAAPALRTRLERLQLGPELGELAGRPQRELAQPPGHQPLGAGAVEVQRDRDLGCRQALADQLSRAPLAAAKPVDGAAD